MEQSPLNQPTMTTMGGRPIKVLYAPSGDILISCRTANGEDCYVPSSAILEMFAGEIVKRVKAQGGQAHGSNV